MRLIVALLSVDQGDEQIYLPKIDSASHAAVGQEPGIRLIGFAGFMFVYG